MGFNFVYTTVAQTAGAGSLALSWTALMSTAAATLYLYL